jgi:hypothetical protein
MKKALKIIITIKYVIVARVSLAFSVVDTASCTVSSGRSIRLCCISYCVADRFLSRVFGWSPTASSDDADAILSRFFSCLVMVPGRACASLSAFLALSGVCLASTAALLTSCSGGIMVDDGDVALFGRVEAIEEIGRVWSLSNGIVIRLRTGKR